MRFKLRGLNLWLPELKAHSRGIVFPEWLTINRTGKWPEHIKDNYAKDRLFFEIKNFKIYKLAKDTKEDGLNEIKFWLDLEDIPALIKCLTEIWEVKNENMF